VDIGDRIGEEGKGFMIDEIDKMGADWRGDPSSAMLEVLDPEQHNTFRDHYLDLPFDLSKAMFITTANVLETIPGPLRDRMEVITIAGYTEEEKVHIARRYLIPRQLDRHGLKEGQLELTDAALRAIIQGYTREAGVRNLEREIGTIARKFARMVAEEGREHLTVDVEQVREFLGKQKLFREMKRRTRCSGITPTYSFSVATSLLPAFSASQRRRVSSDQTLPTPAESSTIAWTSAIASGRRGRGS